MQSPRCEGRGLGPLADINRWRGVHQETGDEVAIKFIHAAGNPDAVSAKKEKAKKIAFAEEAIYAHLARCKGVPKILWKGSSRRRSRLFARGRAPGSRHALELGHCRLRRLGGRLRCSDHGAPRLRPRKAHQVCLPPTHCTTRCTTRRLNEAAGSGFPVASWIL